MPQRRPCVLAAALPKPGDDRRRRAEHDERKAREYGRHGHECGQSSAERNPTESARIDRFFSVQQPGRGQQKQRGHQKIERVLPNQHGVVSEEGIQRGHRRRDNGRGVVPGQVPDDQRNHWNRRDAAGEGHELQGPFRVRQERVQPAKEYEKAGCDVNRDREHGPRIVAADDGAVYQVVGAERLGIPAGQPREYGAGHGHAERQVQRRPRARLPPVTHSAGLRAATGVRAAPTLRARTRRVAIRRGPRYRRRWHPHARSRAA